MPRVKSLLDNLALALYQKARKPLTGTGRWVDAMPDVARVTWDAVQQELSPGELELAIGELVRLTDSQYAVRVVATLDHLEELHPVTFRDAMENYLIIIPTLLRAYFQRPSDVAGTLPPKKWKLKDFHDLHDLLPSRAPELGPGREPKGLDNWQLAELIGFGELTETWKAIDSTNPAQMATIKFITEHEAMDAVRTQQDQFLEAFRLVHDVGVVPLRSVYLQTNPPALEMPYLSGYNLSGLMRDWHWKYDSAKPDAANKLVRRIAEVVAKAHDKGVIHRDLKPSNILLHPTEGDRFTLWIANFGWGNLASARSAILARGGTPRTEQQRLARLGAHGSLYNSPQQTRKDSPDPRDDVYAIGVIWYQLLMKDSHAAPPVDRDWADGIPNLTPLHVELLMSCLATRPDKRPANAGVLAKQLKELSHEQDAGKQFPLKGHSGEYPKLQLSNDSAKSSHVRGKDQSTPVGLGTGHGGLPRFLTNSLGMTFAIIPPGEFMMGSDRSETGRHDDEYPLHKVKISKPFYLGVFLITQSQYLKVMGNNPSLFTKANGGGPDNPVDSVRWDDAEKFCEKLNLIPEEEARNRQYRLPTEAEWEYACRAGTSTPFAYGMTLTNRNAHYATGGAFGKSGGVARTLPVGSLSPNPYGLYDMHGNLQEWVNDWYNEYYYQDSPDTDPQGPTYGVEKVVRGGCYKMFGIDCRSAARKSAPPRTNTPTVGFRVVLIV